MHVDVTLKNYRCFRDSNPATFQVADGLIAFIGINNSGKSTLLKFFFEFRDLFRHLAGALSNVNALTGSGGSFSLQTGAGTGTGVYDLAELFTDDNDRDLTVDLRFDLSGTPQVDRIVVTVARSSTTWSAQFFVNGSALDAQRIQQVAQDSILLTDGADCSTIETRAALNGLAKTLYVGPFRNVLNIGTNSAYYDIQTGQSFVNSWKQFKTGPNKSYNDATQRVNADIRRIFGFGQFEINPYVDDTTLQLYINDRSFKLPSVGSGLAQFILVLANAAIEKPCFILIDEPELNLHPSLQLDFLTTLASYATNGVLFGTHSVGLAKAAADRIYALKPSEQGSQVLDFDDPRSSLAELLGELSYSGYRALGYQTVLLVEGRTDVKTVQQFLRLYKVEHRVVLVPMGGRELINAKAEPELCELSRLSDNVYALIDSERSAANEPLNPQRVAFTKACRAAGITCKVLDRRATENYLSDPAVKKVLGDGAQALQPFDQLTGATKPWSKRENWRIAREMTRADLDQTDLGQFLGSLRA